VLTATDNRVSFLIISIGRSRRQVQIE
jgi:hypothetical protein